jgi:colanic acid biosynthesis glycosyl transferase WcaI
MIVQFPPDVNSTGILMSQVAQGLVKRGHEVSVITSFPHYEKFRVRDEYRGKWSQRTCEQGIDVTRVRVFANGKKEKMNYRLLSYLSFNAMAAVANLIRRNQYDVILCTNGSFFTGVAAYASGGVKGTPFVYNVQDLYPETPVAQGQLTSKRAVQVLSVIERFMYRRAKHITVITPSFRENLIQFKGVSPTQVSVIPNFADTNFIRPLDKINPFSQRHTLTDKFVVSHAGNLGYVYDLGTLVQAAAKLRNESDLLFLIVGDGVMRAQLEAQARDLNLENVRFMNFVPYADLPYLRAASDVQVALYRRGAARYSMPSKLYEIMASGRPVLASAEAGSDVANLVAETDCGICVEPQNVDALVTALLELKRDPARRAEMSARGRAAAEERFSLETVVNQYDALLKSI